MEILLGLVIVLAPLVLAILKIRREFHAGVVNKYEGKLKKIEYTKSLQTLKTDDDDIVLENKTIKILSYFGIAFSFSSNLYIIYNFYYDTGIVTYRFVIIIVVSFAITFLYLILYFYYSIIIKHYKARFIVNKHLIHLYDFVALLMDKVQELKINSKESNK